MAKKKKPAVRTGEIAWRINVTGTLKLFLLFLALDIFLIVFDITTGIIAPAEASGFDLVIQTVKIILATQKYSLLLRGEGLILLGKLSLGTISIRRTLKPIEELTNVALHFGHLTLTLFLPFGTRITCLQELQTKYTYSLSRILRTCIFIISLI